MTNHVTTIAPLLRGLTHDGRIGKIVSFQEAAPSKNIGETLTIAALPSSETDILTALKEALSSYQNEHNNETPRVITIDGAGSFLLGTSYDEAVNGTNVPASYGTELMRNKVCVVTGGAQGFGEGIVRQLAQVGSLIGIADMNKEGAQKLASSLNEEYGRTVAFSVAVNVSDEDSVGVMIDEVTRVAGGIDLFVNNAGVLKAGSVKEISQKDFNFVTSVNYTGYFLCVKKASPVMAAMNTAAGGYFTDIIQINSKSGLEGSNKNGAYAGGKFGGIGLTQSFALELISDNIKVNSICPGNFFDGPLWSDPDRGLFVQYLSTGKVPGAKTIEDVKRFYESKVPMNRGCEAEDVAKALFYAIDQCYETGQAIPVTGGQVMLN